MSAPFTQISSNDASKMAEIRRAADSLNKLTIEYARADGQASKRIIWPLGLFFWGGIWTIGAWCELRNSFRVFRLDRVKQLEILVETFTTENGRSLDDFIEEQKRQEGC